MRELDLEALVLKKGAHNLHGAMCVMEAVAYVAGEPWSDSPKCACPVLSKFLRKWNDDMNDSDRQILKPLIPRLVNSKVNSELEDKRRELISNWFFRVQCPAWLDLAHLKEHAEGGRQQGANYNWDAAWAAAVAAARVAAWAATGSAAWAAAGDAAFDAAWAAARDAARDAAFDAAWVAAWAAARDAAFDAAWAAARDAAGDALHPTVEVLQKSALQLIEQCLEIK